MICTDIASEQLFTAQSKPSMMPESQHAHSVQAKQIQYIVLHVYSQLFLDNTMRLSGMWQAAKWIVLIFAKWWYTANQLYEKATVFIWN